MILRKGYIPGFLYILWGLCAFGELKNSPAAEHSRGEEGSPQRPFWTLEAVDGYCDVREHVRVGRSPAEGPTAADSAPVDHLHLVTGEATTVDLVSSLPPAAVIDELHLTVDVFSTRQGVRLIAEVVLPHTRDRRSGAPLRAVVFGPTYSSPRGWQQLELTDLPLHVQRSVRTMQLSVSETIDARGAYVDRVRLRVRPGRGETTLRIGEIRVRGAVPVNPADGRTAHVVDPRVRLASGEFPAGPRPNTPRDAPPRVELAGGVLHVDGTPLFPRAIENFGGPIREAQGWGCNVVVLPTAPTRAEEREAEAAGLWLIAPPPDPQALATARAMPAFPRVIAWQLGRRLTAVDVDAIRQWAALVRRLDPARNRPLVASVRHDHRTLSRVLDVVMIERQPLGGAVPVDRFVQQLDAERRLVLPGKTVWVWIQTRLPAEVIHQARGLLPAQATELDAGLPADEISRLTWIAVAHGAGGLIFGAPPETRTSGPEQSTFAELRLVNHQLELLDPLLARTGTTRRIAALAPGLSAGVLSNGRTHCVLPWHGDNAEVNRGASAVLGSASMRQTSFVVPGVAEPSDAYLLTPTSATRLNATREAGGVRLAAGPLLPRDIVLLTQDPLAVQQMRAAATARGPQMAVHEWELIGNPRSGRGAVPSDMERLRNVRLANFHSRGEASTGIAAAASFRSSPLGHIPGLSEFDQAYRLLDGRPLPTPNLLPGGDFEGVEATRQAGWRHVQLAHQAPSHQVEVLSGNVHSGAFCLRMKCGDGADDEAAADVAPSAWLASPSIPLQAGDVIRVSGWIRGVPSTGDAASPRAIIDDSLGGEPLALNIAPAAEWQRFVLYRATDAHHEWMLNLACGGGEIFFDGLAVQRVPREVLVSGNW